MLVVAKGSSSSSAVPTAPHILNPFPRPFFLGALTLLHIAMRAEFQESVTTTQVKLRWLSGMREVSDMRGSERMAHIISNDKILNY